MARIYVSGINDEAILAIGTDVREVISGLNPDGDGRIFYLTQLIVANESLTAMGQFELWDQDEATDVSDGDTTCRGSILIGPGDTVQMNWRDGEMPFVTNCVASITAGTVGIGSVQASGYLA
jgi:hypothetical protein